MRVSARTPVTTGPSLTSCARSRRTAARHCWCRLQRPDQSGGRSCTRSLPNGGQSRCHRSPGHPAHAARQTARGSTTGKRRMAQCITFPRCMLFPFTCPERSAVARRTLISINVDLLVVGRWQHKALLLLTQGRSLICISYIWIVKTYVFPRLFGQEAGAGGVTACRGDEIRIDRLDVVATNWMRKIATRQGMAAGTFINEAMRHPVSPLAALCPFVAAVSETGVLQPHPVNNLDVMVISRY